MRVKNPKILMLKGLPASGKSTHARSLVDQGYVRVNKDDLRAMLHNSSWSKSNEKEVLKLRDEVIRMAVRDGKNVVVDDTNFEQVHYDRMTELAQELNANFEVLFIDTPVEECIKRNELRANKVPISVITKMHNRHIAALRNKEPAKYDDNLEECIIVDVDGTLAHLAPGPDGTIRDIYDASRAMEDRVDDAVSNIMAMAYGHGYKVIILTGRGKDEGHLEATKAWLDKNGVNYDEIYSRQVGDERPDTEVKEELYNTYIKGRYNVKYVIDDRPSVCRMWRSLNLFTFQVGDVHHEF